MPSPFPGMDPYLEDPVQWGGVHLRLIVCISTELNLHLPDGLDHLGHPAGRPGRCRHPKAA